MPARVTTDLVWNEIEKHVFAVLSYVNPKGQARSAGIVYIVKDRVVYVGTDKSSWKAKHIGRNPNVALNVTIAKRLPFMPWIKIPAATIAFNGTACVLPANETDPQIVKALLKGMVDDPELFAGTCVLAIEPTGNFVTYGVGVPLLDMRDPKKAMGRTPVS